MRVEHHLRNQLAVGANHRHRTEQLLEIVGQVAAARVRRVHGDEALHWEVVSEGEQVSGGDRTATAKAQREARRMCRRVAHKERDCSHQSTVITTGLTVGRQRHIATEDLHFFGAITQRGLNDLNLLRHGRENAFLETIELVKAERTRK